MRERTLQNLARQEATPEGWERFRPVTKGPVVAFLGLGVLGAFSVVYRTVRAIGRIGGRIGGRIFGIGRI